MLLNLCTLLLRLVEKQKNADEFISSVKLETGIDLKVISAKDEAYFSTMACLDLMDKSYPYGIVFDIGGGSTEISWFKYHHINNSVEMIDYVSVPFGFITIGDPDTSESREMKRIKIRKIIKDFYNRNEIYKYSIRNEIQMIGVSGSINSLVNILLDVDYYNSQVIHGFLMRVNDIDDMIDYVNLANSMEDFPYDNITMKNKRKFLFDSSIIFSEIHREFYMPVTVADRGLRDGIITHLIRS
jgi:exopolyphosphatase / guanosine-5'-triphosphate,3'-diphosphate pyrophosphatase